MELIHTSLLDHKELFHERFDIIIAASGYQPRCTHLIRNIKLENSIRLLITYNEVNFKKERTSHEEFFTDRGFTTIAASTNNGNEISGELKRICTKINSDDLKILVDYSCMPKRWFAAILDFFMRNELQIERLHVYFSYTPTELDLYKNSSSIKYFGPILDNSQQLPSSKPVSLVIGLGRSSDAAVEVIDKVKPERTFAFLPDPAFDSNYTQHIRKSNHKIIDKLPEQNLYSYPAHNTDDINSLLISLCLDLRLDSRVIILAQGPKTFALASLLIAMNYPDIWLWEIITKNPTTKAEGIPHSEPVVAKAVFCQEEDDDDY